MAGGLAPLLRSRVTRKTEEPTVSAPA